jgi:hypothetical protein
MCGNRAGNPSLVIGLLGNHKWPATKCVCHLTSSRRQSNEIRGGGVPSVEVRPPEVSVATSHEKARVAVGAVRAG